MRLFDTLKRWAIEEFAAASFRKHHVGPYQLKKWIPLEVLTSFQQTPLKKPLLQSVPRELKETGVQLFDLLLQFTNVMPCARPAAVLRRILEILQHQNILVDEFYFQLVKQTINNRSLRLALRTWDLFLIISSIFPASQDSYMWIIAHIGRSAVDPDRRIADTATFTFMRFQARFLLCQTAPFGDAPEAIPRDITRGRACFRCLLYEMIWGQRCRYPRLPIPYAFYYMIKVFIDKGGIKTQGVFLPGAQSPDVSGVIATVNTDVTVIGRYDVRMLGNLIVAWLKELPNPLVPVEMADQLLTDGNMPRFIDTIPQLHRLTLLYLVGFLQQLAASPKSSGVGKQDCASLFGPLVVNSARVNRDSVIRVRMNEVAVAMIATVMDTQMPAIIYPMKEQYLEEHDREGHRKRQASDAGKEQRRPDVEAGRPASDTDAAKPGSKGGAKAQDEQWRAENEEEEDAADQEDDRWEGFENE
jgi:hypothetical protein